jgi:hypothetical protein
MIFQENVVGISLVIFQESVLGISLEFQGGEVDELVTIRLWIGVTSRDLV